MNVETYLKDAGVPFEKHEHQVAYTAQEMAAQEHVTGNAVAKTVVVNADGHKVLCVLPASRKLDLSRIATVVRARKCQLVDEPELARLFPDVELGAEPPFGKPYGLDTVVDEHLAKCERITFNAGTHRTAIRMRYADYARLATPQVADFCLTL